MSEKIKKIEETGIEDCFVITPTKFEENSRKIYTINESGGMPCLFVESKATHGKAKSLRGFHGDNCTWKLLTCLSGHIMVAVVDCRQNSPTFRRIAWSTLSGRGNKSLLIPPGCINAHESWSKYILLYQLSEPYRGESSQVTVPWTDPDLVDIPWRFKKTNRLGYPWHSQLLAKNEPTYISERDKKGSRLKEVIF